VTENGGEKLRLDKWLWRARFFKSRSLAAAHIAAGGVRVNRILVRKSHHAIRSGDVVTFPKGPYIRVVEILSLGARRGPAAEARLLFNDLNPPESQPQPERNTDPGRRDPGAGRPTKKQRRQTARFRGGI